MNKPRFLRISTSEKIFFANQLALMLKSGLPPLHALEFLKNQKISKSLRYIIEILIEDLNKGIALHTSLKKFNNQFGNFFISLIRVGEMSGNLPQNLEYITFVLKKENELKNKIISMWIYPLFIFGSTLALSGLVIFVVFPKLMPVFTELQIKLPLITRIFISISNFILHYWYIVIISVFMFLIMFFVLLRIKKIKFLIDKILISLPIINKIIRYPVFSNFSRNLGVLIKSGVEIVTALEISGETVNNLFYQSLFEKAKIMVKEGHNLSEIFKLNQKYFELVMINLIEVGEKTGELMTTLNHLSEYYEEMLDNNLKRFVSLLEPLLLAFMGLIVAFIALAIISPIYQITEQIGK